MKKLYVTFCYSMPDGPQQCGREIIDGEEPQSEQGMLAIEDTLKGILSAKSDGQRPKMLAITFMSDWEEN